MNEAFQRPVMLSMRQRAGVEHVGLAMGSAGQQRVDDGGDAAPGLEHGEVVGAGALDAVAQGIRLSERAENAEDPALGGDEAVPMGGELFLALADGRGAVGGLVLVHDAHLDELGVSVYADAVGAEDLDVGGRGVVGRGVGSGFGGEKVLRRGCDTHS